MTDAEIVAVVKGATERLNRWLAATRSDVPPTEECTQETLAAIDAAINAVNESKS